MNIFYTLIALLAGLPFIFATGYGIKYITFGAIEHIYQIKVVKYKPLFAFVFGLLYFASLFVFKEFYLSLSNFTGNFFNNLFMSIPGLYEFFGLNIFLQIGIGIILFFGFALIWGLIRWRIIPHLIEYKPDQTEVKPDENLKTFLKNSLIIIVVLSIVAITLTNSGSMF